ncbi:hypothetical protein [Vibrio neptunius]|uniref:Uncharacterized protein n=1 Tax=Vibrio neptunius TaxID=170651 RepID=A0ABS3A8Y5_9VIBR|nr:hypothetical protein [Vibrio neptunius]MBN3495723.1 hypothetical protein [Vibrio neptunius]MBN3518147.1 hypothetical protein [Vibrio neptunius]MBN3552510.1 hypothetical protein [Vibrio neptunius]MBN3580550.1 hypothetical protein [Vibrio neptunius]MCH9874217.1 hypothetical protein [Vibrio neptunius]
MKQGLAIALLMICSQAFAEPSIFGMEIGSMTESQLQSQYKVEPLVTNRYTQGNMYSVPVESIDFDGLKSLEVTFSKEGTLLVVLAKLPQAKFDYINGMLKKKYTLVRETIPYVGNKEVVYRESETLIILLAPHLSSEMTMIYTNEALYNEVQRQRDAAERQTQKSEASQL